mgnify:CR=1 FL=1
MLVGSKRSLYVESYQWQIGLERILILPLAPCGFGTPYLSLPPLEISMMIPCTWGLSMPSPEMQKNEFTLCCQIINPLECVGMEGTRGYG